MEQSINALPRRRVPGAGVMTVVKVAEIMDDDGEYMYTEYICRDAAGRVTHFNRDIFELFPTA